MKRAARVTTTNGAQRDSRKGGGDHMDILPPRNDQAERATLGSILLDRDAITAIAGWLTPDHFASPKLADVYAAMLACYGRREPPDLTSVADELRRRGTLEDVGGVPFLIDLSNATPTAYHIEYQAKIVQRTALFRRAIQIGGQIAALGYDETQDEATLIANVLAAAMQLQSSRATDGPQSLAAIVNSEYEALSAVLEGTVQPGISTGFRDLDVFLGGLFPSDLLILAARPGVGKTSLVLSIARSLIQRGVATGLFELEMSRAQLLLRLLADSTGIDAARFRRGGAFSQDEITQTVDTLGALSEYGLYVDDTPRLTIADLRSRALRLQADHDVRVLLVDYLGKLRDPSARDRVQEVSSIARGLKDLAKELHIPIIACAQLNRQTEGRADHRPTLADLRDSGEIEQEADAVLFLYRDELYKPDSLKAGTADVLIEKNRHGPLGTVTLIFNKHTTGFASYSARSPQGD